jgi:hypothetical protein
LFAVVEALASGVRPDGDGHIFLIHLDELAQFSHRAGLEIIQVDLFNNPLTAGHMKLSLLHPFIPRDFIGRLESLSQSRVPPGFAERIFIQIGVCFHKPEQESGCCAM